MSRTPPEQFLRTDRVRQELAERSVRGGAITVAAQGGKVLLSLSTAVLLSRLLVPADFGLFVMVASVLNLFFIIQDFGLSTATAQRATLDHAEVSTLFWLNAAIGVVVALVSVAISPAIAWFYEEPGLVAMTASLSAVFVFAGLSTQHRGLLLRQMRLTRVALVELGAMACGLAVGLVSALLGAGHWALVLVFLTSHATIAAGMWLACGWRPGRPARSAGVGALVSYGKNLTGFKLADFVSRNADDVLIGRVWGASPLGLYSIAHRLMLLPMREISFPLSSVVIPGMSRLQNEPRAFREYYCKASLLSGTLGMPFVVFLFVIADDAVAVLGSQWEGAALLFRLLAPAAFVSTFNMTWVCAALGRTDRMLRWQIYATSTILSGFLIGVPWGAVGIAAAYSIATAALRIPAMVYLLKGSPVRPSRLLRVLWRPALASLGAGSALAFLIVFVELDANLFSRLSLYVLCFGSLYVVAWLALHRGAGPLGDLIRLGRQALQGR